MCKGVYRGEGIHVKMREVETYRKPSKTHTHTSTDTYPHTQSQSGTHFKDKLNEAFLHGLYGCRHYISLWEKEEKEFAFFIFFFTTSLVPPWLSPICQGACLCSVRAVRHRSDCAMPDCTDLSRNATGDQGHPPPHTNTLKNQHCKHRDNVHGSPMGEEGEGGEGYPLARLNPNASNLFSVALRYLHLTSVPLSCQTQL